MLNVLMSVENKFSEYLNDQIITVLNTQNECFIYVRQPLNIDISLVKLTL